MKGAWLTGVGLSLLSFAPGAEEDLGRKVFAEIAQPPCAVCHTLKAAGATGTVGPSLDELKPDKERVLEAVRNGVGIMPAFERLTREQIEAVAAYVARVSGK